MKLLAQGPRLGGGARFGQTRIQAGLHGLPTQKPRTRGDTGDFLGRPLLRFTCLDYSSTDFDGTRMEKQGDSWTGKRSLGKDG